jgi:hypothetical protein
MSLEKKVTVDLVELVESGCVQVRTATQILEDGVLLTQSYQRHVIAPGDDYSTEDPKVQAICNAAHTQEVIDAWKSRPSNSFLFASTEE